MDDGQVYLNSNLRYGFSSRVSIGRVVVSIILISDPNGGIVDRIVERATGVISRTIP